MTRFDRTPEKTRRARSLRHAQTDAETKLWQALKGKQFDGLKFRRQHPVGQYVLDFYCPELRLCIEVDGGQHNEPNNIKRDDLRSKRLSKRGVTVVRFWNFEIFENLEGVIDMIHEHARMLKYENSAREFPSP